MTETIRYSLIGREDLNLGTGTFDVTLADGTVVTLNQISLTDMVFRSYTKAGLPTAGTANRLVRVTDDIGGIWIDTGTQWRPINGGWIDVTQAPFNADPTGIQDASSNINDAVEELYGNGGGVCFFPPGTYLLSSESIRLRSNVWYVGSGIGITIIKFGASTINGFGNYPNFPAHSRIRVCNLTIDGNYSSISDPGNDNYGIGIYPELCTDSIFDNLEIKNMWYVGIENYNNAHRNIIANNRFTNVGDKFTVVAPSGYYQAIGNDFGNNDCTIYGNIIVNCGQGITLHGDGGTIKGTTIVNNKFRSISGFGIIGRQGNSGLIIANNYAESLGDGFINIFDDNAIAHSGGNTHNVVIENNTAKTINTAGNAGIYAIALTAEYGASIIGNIIDDVDNLSGDTGGININVAVTFDQVGTIVSKNTLRGKFNGRQAILINSADDVLVEGNVINGKTVATGITVASGSTSTIIEKNKFIDCATEISDSGTLTKKFDTGWGADQASVAGTQTLPLFGSIFNITGTNTITSITAAGNAGRTVTLVFTSTAGMTDGSNLKLAGSFSGTADDAITLVCDGTNWYEISRSAN